MEVHPGMAFFGGLKIDIDIGIINIIGSGIASNVKKIDSSPVRPVLIIVQTITFRRAHSSGRKVIFACYSFDGLIEIATRIRKRNAGL
jgi:hypothetical protein